MKQGYLTPDRDLTFWGGAQVPRSAWQSATATSEVTPFVKQQMSLEESKFPWGPSKSPQSPRMWKSRSALRPRKGMAPQVGLEPTTLRLTAGCSAIELLRSVCAPCGASNCSRIVAGACALRQRPPRILSQPCPQMGLAVNLVSERGRSTGNAAALARPAASSDEEAFSARGCCVCRDI